MSDFAIGLVVVLVFVAIVVVGLLLIARARDNRPLIERKEASTCMICSDEAPEVCRICPKRKVHDRLITEMEALGGEVS